MPISTEATLFTPKLLYHLCEKIHLSEKAKRCSNPTHRFL